MLNFIWRAVAVAFAAVIVLLTRDNWREATPFVAVGLALVYALIEHLAHDELRASWTMADTRATFYGPVGSVVEAARELGYESGVPFSNHSGAALIARERQRQRAGEGYSDEHDDAHGSGELIRGAIAYASHAFQRLNEGGLEECAGAIWPFDDESWKPGPTAEHDLVKAGALIAAELDRLARRRNQAAGVPSE